MIDIPQQQIPGVYHRRVGDIVVTAISDGFLDGSMQVLRNITVDEATRILAKSFRPARRTSVNAFLIHPAGRLALVDTGDEVVLTDPTYSGLLNRVRLAGGVPRLVPLLPGADGWTLDRDALRKCVSRRTRMLLLMSPAMPSGAVLTRDDWRAATRTTAICRSSGRSACGARWRSMWGGSPASPMTRTRC